MAQGKNNVREWRFGMKAHVRSDLNGPVRTLVTTHAGAADFAKLPRLLHGQEKVPYDDQAYWSELHRVRAGEPVPGPALASCSAMTDRPESRTQSAQRMDCAEPPQKVGAAGFWIADSWTSSTIARRCGTRGAAGRDLRRVATAPHPWRLDPRALVRAAAPRHSDCTRMRARLLRTGVQGRRAAL